MLSKWPQSVGVDMCSVVNEAEIHLAPHFGEGKCRVRLARVHQYHTSHSDGGRQTLLTLTRAMYTRSQRLRCSVLHELQFSVLFLSESRYREVSSWLTVETD